MLIKSSMLNTNFLKMDWGSLLTINFPKKAPLIAIINNKGIIQINALSKKPLLRYTGILVMSIANAIAAEVAIYFVFSRLNEVKKAPLIAPPVPMIPAKKPDKEPPIIEFFVDWLMENEGLKNE